MNFPEKKCGIIFAFEGNDSVTGSSASLAFALKMVYKVKEYTEDAPIPFSIAATGIVDGINKEAHIIKVDYMNQKIEAALKTLNTGDIIFFPIDNVPEILQKNIERCHQRGIKLQAVSTISDAVHKLLEYSSDNKKTHKINKTENLKKNRKVKWISFVLCAVLMALLFFLINNEINSNYPSQKINPSKITQKLDNPDKNVSTLNELKKERPIIKEKPFITKEKIIKKEPLDINEREVINEVPLIKTDQSKQKPIKIKRTKTIKNFPRIKVSLAATDQSLNKMIRTYLESLFQRNGFVIDNSKFNAELTGKVSIYNKQEYQLDPYSGPSETVVQKDIVIQNLSIQLDHTERSVIKEFVYTIETMKTNDTCDNRCMKGLFDQLHKKINFQTIRKLFKN